VVVSPITKGGGYPHYTRGLWPLVRTRALLGEVDVPMRGRVIAQVR